MDEGVWFSGQRGALMDSLPSWGLEPVAGSNGRPRTQCSLDSEVPVPDLLP